jgi:hypothetical protein
MKNVLFIALALLLFAGSAYAQPSVIIYTDTTLAGQITDAQSAAALLRGFTGYTTLSSDIEFYNNRYLTVSFRGKTSRALLAANSFTADSVKIQGLLQKKTSPNKMDTVWVDIPVTFENWASGINTASGLQEWRDTTMTWISAREVGNSRGYITPQFKLPDYFDEYRVVNGTKDSGRVVIKQAFLPNR